MAPFITWWSTLILLLVFSSIGSAVPTTDAKVLAKIGGRHAFVKDNRRPALYTGNFGDCMGSSSLNVTRFDAAYYKDNMTVAFHLAGETALKNESIMMYIGVYAYGENRFDLTFNPCDANIWSACPMQAEVDIEANGIIPINQTNAATIPPIALSIPDFEGEAILRIFANSSESEIGCFSAVITNGASFSQPAYVGTALGLFTFVAAIASFATTIYGNRIPEMRKHYAHSLSAFVVFSVWHHIFLSGALSMNWPRVLVAFWSNYAWSAGMIYTESMQNTINNFIGSNKGNTSAVGAAGTGVENNELGGGYDIHSIYKREVFPTALNIPGLVRRSKYNRVAHQLEDAVARRELANHANGYKWYGQPVKPGLPLPGNFSGFAGTLAQENIPASNAFMTGFLWFVILIVAVASAVVAFKLILEGLVMIRLMRKDRLPLFRAHYLGYTAVAVLRTLFIGFFMIMFLCLFQFTYLASPAPVAVACVVFLFMLIGLGGLAGYACFYHVRFGDQVSEPDRLNVQKKRILKFIPWYGVSRSSTAQPSEDNRYAGSIPWWKVRVGSEEKSIHDDDDFTKKFGWLASRFRRTRWWFFVVFLIYESIRACFLAGASGSPKAQVFGLLAIEFMAFIGLVILRPFEGQRLNLIVVYLLGFSKIATTALSAAFDRSFGLPRIPATVIGIVIIVIQGLLTVVVLVAIVVGAISTYLSVTRNREEVRPKILNKVRPKYFAHMDFKVIDKPPPPPPTPEPPEPPYFNVNSIKRVAKIEDEDPEFVAEMSGNLTGTPASTQKGVGAPSKAASLRSQVSYSNLPYGARPHRPSWSSERYTGPSTIERQRQRPSSMAASREPDSRPGSRAASRMNSRFSVAIADSQNRRPSPVTPFISSLSVPGPSRQKSATLGSTERPQIRPLRSENSVPTFPGSSNWI